MRSTQPSIAHWPENKPAGRSLVMGPVARNMGLFGLLRRMHRRDLLVLVVHGVVPSRDELIWQPLREQVDVQTFEKQIDFIARTHTFIDLDGINRVFEEDEPVRNPVLITFDDGYRNNIDLALPVLERRGIRPLLFVTTGYLNNVRTFWFDRFDYAIQQIRTPWTIEVDGHHFVFRPSDRIGMKHTYRLLREHSKNAGWDDLRFHDAFSAWCDSIEAETGKSLSAIQAVDPWSATLDPEQIRRAVARGAVDIGSHTIDHMRIDKLEAAERRRQLVESRLTLEAITGIPCRSFCYPNGDWDEPSMHAVSDAGYDIAFTTEVGFNRADSNLLALKRQFLPATFDPDYLEALGSGALAVKERLNRMLATAD